MKKTLIFAITASIALLSFCVAENFKGASFKGYFGSIPDSQVAPQSYSDIQSDLGEVVSEPTVTANDETETQDEKDALKKQEQEERELKEAQEKAEQDAKKWQEDLERAKKYLGSKTRILDSFPAAVHKKDAEIQRKFKLLVEAFIEDKDDYTRSIGIYLYEILYK